jgi:hypothetical protein
MQYPTKLMLVEETEGSPERIERVLNARQATRSL